MKQILYCYLLFFLLSCTENKKEGITPVWIVSEITSPAGESGEPNLFSAANGQLYLSWVAYADDTTDVLQFSQLENDEWSTPTSIAKGTDWFVNWADFPSLAMFSNGKNMAAHFLAKSANGTYDYDVHITQSGDGGQSWSESFIIHKDGVAAEHGFVSLLPIAPNRMFAAWLDGRNTKAEGGAMTLRTANFDPNGRLYEEAELDHKVCDCCQTDAALTENGPIVVYRDRTDGEVRDIAIVRKVAQQWTEPKVVFPDNWQIAGCPVNGPAVAAQKKKVALAWFTAANEKPMVKVAFSSDAGVTFREPIQIDQGKPLGRVDVLITNAGQTIVSWMETAGEQAEIKVVKFNTDLEQSEPAIIATNSGSRASGFPILAQSKDELYIAWTQVDSVSTFVKTARFGWE